MLIPSAKGRASNARTAGRLLPLELRPGIHNVGANVVVLFAIMGIGTDEEYPRIRRPEGAQIVQQAVALNQDRGNSHAVHLAETAKGAVSIAFMLLTSNGCRGGVVAFCEVAYHTSVLLSDLPK